MCAKISSYLETTVITHVVELLASLYPGAGERDIPYFNPSNVIRRLNNISIELLKSFVDIYGRQLSLIIQRSLSAADWLNHKEPRGPRPVCQLILAKLAETEMEVLDILEDDGNRSPSQSKTPTHQLKSSIGGTTTTMETMEESNLERNVAKLFQQKTEITKTTELSRSSIQAAIACVGLKSFIECLRLETLGRAGLQQIQLDVYYLKPLLENCVMGKESVAMRMLLDEIVSTATERSVDPTLLEIAVIEEILNRFNN